MKLLFSIALLVLLTSCKNTPGYDRNVDIDIGVPYSIYSIEW